MLVVMVLLASVGVPTLATDADAGVRAQDVVVEVGDRSFSAPVFAPTAAGRHPVVVFGHGYLATVERYESTLRDMATRGFLVVAPRSGDELFPSHAAFASDFSVVLDWMEQQDADAVSWLHETVLRGAYGASGHSMGGGASLLAAAADGRFRTVANLAAADTRPSAVAAMPAITAPVLLIAGSDDAITPIAEHQQRMFDAKSSGRVELRVIEGGSHCGFLDPDAVLALACDSGPMPSQEQAAIAQDLLGDWFQAALLPDAPTGSRPSVDPRVTLQSKDNDND